MYQRLLPQLCHRGLCNAKRRSNRGNLNSSALRWMGWGRAVCSPSLLTPWLGELSLSTTMFIAVSNMSGQNTTWFTLTEPSADATLDFIGETRR